MNKIKGTVEKVEDEEKYAAIFMDGERYSSASWDKELPKEGSEVEIKYKDKEKDKNVFHDLIAWRPIEEAKKQQVIAADEFPVDKRTLHVELMVECFVDAEEVFLRLPEGSRAQAVSFDMSSVAIALFDKRATPFFYMKNDKNGE